LQITVIDILYGGIASAIAGAVATLAARAVASWMG